MLETTPPGPQALFVAVGVVPRMSAVRVTIAFLVLSSHRCLAEQSAGIRFFMQSMMTVRRV